MKIITEGKTLSLVIGEEELDILHGLLSTAIAVWPRNPSVGSQLDKWHTDRQRMASMLRAMQVHLGYTETGKIDGPYLNKHKLPKDTPCPFCERKLRGEQALQEHLKTSHKKEQHV
jgi:hypothetical protein